MELAANHPYVRMIRSSSNAVKGILQTALKEQCCCFISPCLEVVYVTDMDAVAGMLHSLCVLPLCRFRVVFSVLSEWYVQCHARMRPLKVSS